MNINLKKLHESINKDANLIYEGLNTIEAKKLYSLVVDLYEEINCFEKEAPHAAVNALSPHLNHIHDMLENMLREPLNYVSQLKDDKTEEYESDEEEYESEEDEEEDELSSDEDLESDADAIEDELEID